MAGSALSASAPPDGWLAIDDAGDVVLVSATGGIAADRAPMLWAEIEYALERACGARVAVDLTGVIVFDEHSLDEIALAAKDSLRRHLDLCFITSPNSPLDQYLRCSALIRSIGVPIFSSVYDAVSTETTPGRWYAA
jgi:anti-anti-sigma regulatory factor